MAASVRREGEALVFAGALERTSVAALWRQAQPLLAGARRLELGAVEAVDSAGLALLAELAERAGAAVVGAPPGLGELRAAYRLNEGLGYAG
ncbi:STAS domain-containing protein [Lysobacter silvisoli]|uniref:STAS domain-containing protein n=1 Tax=Lysobacter silvisoli TaxID=2293254 RepID=A0A371JYI2_9GAMM|nr:STAS domain-containing protein [Lysobacter silvisoli]RDZ26627.1 STAS domain-containing protein [Lysobacter silvisoli]